MMFVQFMMSSDKILVRSAMKCWVESEMVRGGRFVHRSYVCLKVLKRASWYWAGGALIIPADTGEYRGTSIFGFQVTVVTSPAAIFFFSLQKEKMLSGSLDRRLKVHAKTGSRRKDCVRMFKWL